MPGTDGSDEADSVDGPVMDGRVPAAVADGVAYFQTADVRGLGPALRWAANHGADRLTLIAESAVAPDLARRATLVTTDVTVWSADGPEVAMAEPAPAPAPPEPPADHQRFAALISEAGARPVNDHGMLIAEVAGLEVARVVDADHDSDSDPGSGFDPGSGVDPGYELENGLARSNATGPQLVVGVGQADRELQGYIHGHLDDDANLRRAIAAVVRHRRPGSGSHPLTRLARQRWLRSVLLDQPDRFGLPPLEPLSPMRPRQTVLDDEPVAAVGGLDGPDPVVVVCSVGADLDLLPEAADYRHMVGPAARSARLVVVMPERDRQLSIGRLESVVPNLQVEPIEVPWAG